MKAVLVVAVLAVLLSAMTGYRLRLTSAAGVQGSVVRTTPFSEAVALLIRTESGGCHVALVRRFGPLWRSEGGTGCRWADESHPFQYTGWGDGWGPKDDWRSALAVGGIFSDDRITAIRMGGQPEQPVSPETGYLFVYESNEIGGFPPTQALAADGSILYTLHMGTGWEWVSPPTVPPLPGRVTKQEELAVRDATDGILAADPRSSIWLNGEVQIDGEWQPFYVWADGRNGMCGLGTAVSDRWVPWYEVYPCPEPMGALRITGIDKTGQTVSFAAPDGRTGRFDLAARTWHIGRELGAPPR